MVTTTSSPESRIILKNISWQTYETLLLEMGEDRNCRLAYDQGKLEIMTPSMPHEHNNRLLQNMVVVLAEELMLNLKSVGSLTCKRPDMLRGVEPDSCFYIENEPKIRAKEAIDLTIDPPPDLVIEVDYSSLSLERLPIYLALGIPEVWRYQEFQLFIYQKQGENYEMLDFSPTFSNLPLLEIPRFLEESLRVGEIAMLRSFRNWVRQESVSNRK